MSNLTKVSCSILEREETGMLIVVIIIVAGYGIIVIEIVEAPILEKITVLDGKRGHLVQKAVLFEEDAIQQGLPIRVIDRKDDLINVQGNNESLLATSGMNIMSVLVLLLRHFVCFVYTKWSNCVCISLKLDLR